MRARGGKHIGRNREMLLQLVDKLYNAYVGNFRATGIAFSRHDH